MIQSLRIEARKSEEIFSQLQEIQESVRLAFLNCFLDFAGMLNKWLPIWCFNLKTYFMILIFFTYLSGHLEEIGIELVQNKSSKETLHLQNGYTHESEDKLSLNIPGSVVNSHQQLLIVLSNIGYCKDELAYELYKKYKSIWHQSRYAVIYLPFFHGGKK